MPGSRFKFHAEKTGVARPRRPDVLNRGAYHVLSLDIPSQLRDRELSQPANWAGHLRRRTLDMRIAINGCGVAGPTVAWWLRHYGHEPVLFERANHVRSGGYLIDFWGTGYDVAERMGILPVLKPHAYRMRELRTVTASGRPTSTIDATVFDEITHGRYFSIARSDLSTEILNACDGIEARFGTGIVGIEDHGTYVDTALSNGPNERFDLVIGADGLNSEVRSGSNLTFESWKGFPSGSLHASLAHANRNFHFSQAC